MFSEPAAIGIFDSGVGGLSVLRAVSAMLPCHPLLYVADQAHVPYGAKTQPEVLAFSEEISRFLLEQGARVIVVACNTASAAALYPLRETFADIPFVGMEPAVKPAANHTHSGVIGVLATPGTFRGPLYNAVVDRFARGVKVLESTCPGLVAQIEAGALATPATREILEQALLPMLEQNADTIVMGCTHYPFVIPLIQEIVGPTVEVIDPAPAVARQVGRVLAERGLRVEPCAEILTPQFFTTGSPAVFQSILKQLVQIDAHVQNLYWNRGVLA